MVHYVLEVKQCIPVQFAKLHCAKQQRTNEKVLFRPRNPSEGVTHAICISASSTTPVRQGA
jgi:hypothetical protein